MQEGIPRVVPAQEGGGSCAERGVPTYFLCTSCTLPMPILPTPLLARFHLYTMQKGVAIFVSTVDPVTLY